MEPFSFHLIPWNTQEEAQHCSINNPLYLFNGTFQNFLLSHILQFINVTLPFAVFVKSLCTTRARLVHEVLCSCTPGVFFSPPPLPSPPRPAPQSCHRICQSAECGTRTLVILFQVVAVVRAKVPRVLQHEHQELRCRAAVPLSSTYQHLLLLTESHRNVASAARLIGLHKKWTALITGWYSHHRMSQIEAPDPTTKWTCSLHVHIQPQC